MSDFSNHSPQPSPKTSDRFPSVSPLIMVETAFLASTASLIWFINYYFPLGPLLRVFFSLPIALLYLRWDRRAAIMGTVTSGLLLTVLMGPTRSILYVIPYGWMGVVLGGLWKRGAMWPVTVAIGSLIGAIGFFFRYWLLSILLGRDLWVYATTQIAQLLESIFIRLGVLAPPSLLFIQIVAVLMVLANNIVYLFVVHLVSLLMLDRLKSPIPRPPRWVQILLDYDE